MIDEKIRARKIYRVTILGFVVNLLLAIAKFIAGVVGRSPAMVADAVHSVSDFATDAVVLIFVKLSSKPKDEDHNYGHGKYETLATTIIGIALVVVGVGILVNSAMSISDILKGKHTFERPGRIAIAMAAVSIVVKELLYWISVVVGRKVKSKAVIANAWHHRSDALSSIVTLLGIALAYRLGGMWSIAEPIAAIVVGALIISVGVPLVRVGFDELMERSLPREVEQKILDIVNQNEHSSLPHNLRTRMVGNSAVIEIHIRVDGEMSVNHSHQITKDIEAAIRTELGHNTIVTIHVEPLRK